MDYNSRDQPTLYDLGLQDGTHVAYDHGIFLLKLGGLFF